MYPFTLFKYSNINAKLKGMYAKKIKPKDLEELINQEDLKSAIFILKMKNPELNNLSDQANRIQIEAKLDEIIISDIIKIYRLLGRKDKIIFQQFIEKYKLKCIKSVFRRVFLNHDILYDNTENIREWTNSIFKDISGLENVKDKNGFLEIIQKTKYAEIFNNLVEKDEKQINVFMIENMLDKNYLNNLLNTVKKEDDSLEKMVIQEIDLINLLWIYRIKKYYKFSNDKLHSMVIQVPKNNGINIEELIDAEDDIGIIEKLKQSNFIKNSSIKFEIEQETNRIWHKINVKEFKNKFFSIASICAYINLIELENTDIIRIIEGIRYGISKQDIQNKLIGKVI